MKNILSVTLLFIILSTQVFAQTDVDVVEPIPVGNKEEVSDYIGKYITIRGEVSNTKIPQILGVDVISDAPDLRGEIATATGILEQWVVAQDEVEQNSANRGAGTFYRLRKLNATTEAQVQKLD